METMNHGAQDHPEGMPFVMTEAMRVGLRERGYSDEEIREIPPGRAHTILRVPPKFMARWKRDGFSDERIAQLIQCYLQDADDDPGPSERDEEEEDDPPVEDAPNVSPEMQVALDAGMHVGAQTIRMATDDGFEEVTVVPAEDKAEAGSTYKAKPPPQMIQPFTKAQVGFDEALGKKLEANNPIDVRDAKAAAALKRMPVLRFEELAKLPKPVWLLNRHIPENGISVIYGPSHSGKSFLALAWALCIAAGIPWLGYQTKQAQVVYIYAEQPEDIYPRALAWKIARGERKLPVDFVGIPRPIIISDPRELALLAVRIKQEFGDRPPKLIIIDTLNRC
jgi:hypothetical protein